MSQYSKAQEYRVRDIFLKNGVAATRVPLSGACHAIGMGDVVVAGGKATVDHKSTRGKKTITIHREDLEKVAEQAGEGMGILSFSFFGNNTVYATIPLEALIKLLKHYWGMDKPVV